MTETVCTSCVMAQHLGVAVWGGHTCTPAPFPPGSLKPEWEGDPAHIQTVSATDRQIDGFNLRPDETEWIVYFTNPATGACAQMFARMRPYPEVLPAARCAFCTVEIAPGEKHLSDCPRTTETT